VKAARIDRVRACAGKASPECERHVQHFGVVYRLLHSVADGVIVVLRLNFGDWRIGPVTKDIIGPLLLPGRTQLAEYEDPTICKKEPLREPEWQKSTQPPLGRRDVLSADVAFRKLLIIRQWGTPGPFFYRPFFGILREQSPAS
jgi:hypothetical protein